MAKIKFKKSLGQNFLQDGNIIAQIIKSCPSLSDLNILEVGPGSGNLTQALLTRAQKVVALEKDSALQPYLEDLKAQYGDQFEFYIKDALKFKLTQLGDLHEWAIVANLPYNVGTLLFMNWLQEGSSPGVISSSGSAAEGDYKVEDRCLKPSTGGLRYMVLMFQKEVAQRITASVGARHYGRLALFTQLYGRAEYLFTVSANCFFPKPAVESAVIRFCPYTAQEREQKVGKIDTEVFVTIVQEAFAQRRKMLKASLKRHGFDFAALGIDPELRPEQISFEEFKSLTWALANKGAL